MKDAINYFIPILKDPMNDITGRCMTNNGLDSAYCGSYHPATAAIVIQPHQPANVHFPDVQMETNSMEIQYNNHIEIDDYPPALLYQQQQHEQRLQQNRKRNSFDCNIDSVANAKRCRREDADPSLFLPSECAPQAPEQPTEAAQPPLPKTPSQTQMHQRQPTHNMPDMPRCLMGHYV